MIKSILGGMLAATALSFCATAAMAEPEVVAGPARRTGMLRTVGCRHASSSSSRRRKVRTASRWPTAIIANTWRIQMIQTAKAYAAQPDVAAKLKEFKVVSTGEDVPAQIAAVNNFIDSGYDAIVVNAQNPTAFAPVIKQAKEAGVVLLVVRQHPRHRGRDQRQRRPEGPRHAVRATGCSRRSRPIRQDPGRARRRRHVGRHRPRTTASTRRFAASRQELGSDGSRRQVG